MSRLEFGRIRQLPSGTYQARYALADGSERNGPRTFDSYDEARRFLETVAAEMKSGEWVDPRLAAIPFGEYARGWLTQRTDPLSPRTEELYRQQLRSHILPTWESTPLSAISPQGIRVWYAELLESGRSRGVAAKSYRLIRAILNTAVEDERIRRNPCRLRNAGVERHDERVPPTLDELSLLLDATPPRYKALIELAAWSGLRWGELIVLTRADLDVLRGTVTVDKALIETENGIQLGPPKTAAGRRVVALPPHLLPAIRRHLATYVDSGAQAKIFTGPKGAQLRRRSFAPIWRRIRTEAGLPSVHIHDLRHLAATLAATTGATTKELMARMGHSSPRAALIYQHATHSRDIVIAGALSEMAQAHAASRPERGRLVALPERRG